jgi:hypothetical protein
MMEPAAFVMTRRMLLGVKERAEALRASASDDEHGSSTTSPASGVAADAAAP